MFLLIKCRFFILIPSTRRCNQLCSVTKTVAKQVRCLKRICNGNISGGAAAAYRTVGGPQQEKIYCRRRPSGEQRAARARYRPRPLGDRAIKGSKDGNASTRDTCWKGILDSTLRRYTPCKIKGRTPPMQDQPSDRQALGPRGYTAFERKKMLDGIEASPVLRQTPARLSSRRRGIKLYQEENPSKQNQKH